MSESKRVYYRDMHDVLLGNRDISRYGPHISQFKENLILKKSNLDFLASNLIGVDSVVFTDADVNTFCEGFNLDYRVVKNQVRMVTDINKKFKVQVNPFYMLVSNMLHNVVISSAKDKLKERIIKDLIFIIFFRMFSSTYNAYFSRKPTLEEANMVYNSLSNAYDSKKYGSNMRVILAKVDGIYVKNLVRMRKNTAKDYGDMVSDISGRERSYLKGWFEAYERAKEAGESVTTTSLAGKDPDGEEIMVDVIDINAKQYDTGRKIIFGSLIDGRIIALTCDTMVKVKEKDLVDYIHAFEDWANELEGSVSGQKRILDFVELLVATNVNHIYNTNLYPPYHKNMATLLKFIRDLWKSSRTSDKNVAILKKELFDNLFKRIKTKNKDRAKLLTIAFLCYLYIKIIVTTEDA